MKAGREPLPAPYGAAWPALVAVVVLWMALFAPQLFRGQAFTLGDANVFRPFAEFSRERWVTAHERTFWNPYVFAGIPSAPSLADPRPQWLPDRALDAFERWRPSRAFPLGGPLFAHLAGMLAMSLRARALWGVNTAGMAFAGITWGLLPELLVPFAFGHDAQCVSASLVPVVLLAVHAVCAAGSRRRTLAAALGLAAAAALQVLNGHPQVVVYGVLVALLFAIDRARAFGRPARALWIAGAVALAVAMSAAVWLPSLRYSASSFRGEGGITFAEVARFSFAWRDLLALVWPWAVGFGDATYWGGMAGNDYPRYLGVATVTLAGAVVIAGWRDGPRTIRLFAAIALVSVLLSLGTTLGPVYRALHRGLPLFSMFRAPTLWSLMAGLAVTLLAARAFAPDIRSPRRARVTLGIAGVLALLGVLIAWGPLAHTFAAEIAACRPGFDPHLLVPATRQAGLDLAARAAILAVALLLLRALALGGHRVAAGWAFVSLVVLDSGSVTVPVLQRASGPFDRLAATAPPALVRVAEHDSHLRVSSTRDLASTAAPGAATHRAFEFYSNDWIRWRTRTLGGIHGAVPGLWRPLSQITRSYGALCALGVSYMSGTPDQVWDEQQFERVSESASEVVYRLRGALGRSYAVPQVRALGNDIAVIDAMMSPAFDPGEVALSADAAIAGRYPGSRDTRLAWIEDGPDRIEIDADTGDLSFVVLADTWFPGWTAELDGQRVELYRVDQLVRGVAVPAGHHRIGMRYLPEGWRVGATASRVGWTLWLVVTLATLGAIAFERGRRRVRLAAA